MNVIVEGKQRRFVEAFVGNKRVVEIWLGNRQIWPCAEGVARRIVVELPESGTEDWQYWMHALDATRSSSTPINYMRFCYDGLSFYIQNSPDGTPSYQLEDNMLVLGQYDDGILIDQLGEYLEVEARIAKRQGEKQIIRSYERYYTLEWGLPLIGGTQFGMELYNYSRKRSTYSYFGDIISLPSGVSWSAAQGSQKHNRNPRSNAALIKDKEVPDSDTGCSCSFMTSGGCYYDPSKGQYQYAFPEYPAFTRKFKLKIISVS